MSHRSNRLARIIALDENGYPIGDPEDYGYDPEEDMAEPTTDDADAAADRYESHLYR